MKVASEVKLATIVARVVNSSPIKLAPMMVPTGVLTSAPPFVHGPVLGVVGLGERGSGVYRFIVTLTFARVCVCVCVNVCVCVHAHVLFRNHRTRKCNVTLQDYAPIVRGRSSSWHGQDTTVVVPTAARNSSEPTPSSQSSVLSGWVAREVCPGDGSQPHRRTVRVP